MTHIVFKENQELYIDVYYTGYRKPIKVEFSHYIDNPSGKANCVVFYNDKTSSLNSDNLRVYK